MIDFYTKAVLTTIAVALSVIALQNFIPRASAQFGNERCGTSFREPCYIATGPLSPLEMRVIK